MTELLRVPAVALRTTVERAFSALGMPAEDAAISADALIEADLMGISSHGVSNYIQLIYAPGLRSGSIVAQPEIRVVRDGGCALLVDGGSGMGHVVGHRAMRLAIEKAKMHGVGLATVRNSRHYGAAGYYALLAAREGCIGISMTNADALVLPTHGRDARLGTNPIALAAPTGEQPLFLLDMATSTVPLGKIMLAARAGQRIPKGWAADERGRPTTDPEVAFEALRLLPLGGTYEQGSHKGYGLALLVDVLAGALSDGIARGGAVGGSVGHFFCAVDVEALRPLDEFRASMDELLQTMQETPRVDEAEPVIYPGWKEHHARLDREANGIPLHPKVVEYLNGLCDELGVEPAWAASGP
ncbi:MAG TPA: Ldh family oxidoreductase [Thermoanaerobaculia bacterium]|nr:Ldh family oxidoreductase [Thermoanaerobaculia bacterium]